ncbi:MAG: tetratricopeptide repeat protein [Rhodovulum sp.]|nr:tetratricopeptide repeat protein [Rhodovulum sp.]
MASKTCFVIAPIGDPGTDTRTESDALLWVINSALDRFGFKVIRVDQIARSSIITNEIVQLIQEADLCISILTDNNPNVFYETGRRHETAKPFIQLIKKGQTLPFDVAGIRTIIYNDIDTRAGAAEAIANIREFVEEFEKSGYGTSGAGVSLASLASTIERIERKLNAMPLAPHAAGAPFGPVGSSVGLEKMFRPKEALIEALMQGNLSEAAALLPSIVQRSGKSEDVLMMAAVLASAGFEVGVNVLWDALGNLDGLKSEFIGQLLGSIVSFYLETDREKEVIDRVHELVEGLIRSRTIGAQELAAMYNQEQRLLYGAGDYEKALSVAEKAIELSPGNSSYLYNCSLIYERLKLPKRAVEFIDRALSVADKEDPDHLRHAVEMYVECDRAADARAAFEKLARIASHQARMLLLNDEVRRVVS